MYIKRIIIIRINTTANITASRIPAIDNKKGIKITKINTTINGIKKTASHFPKKFGVNFLLLILILILDDELKNAIKNEAMAQIDKMKNHFILFPPKLSLI